MVSRSSNNGTPTGALQPTSTWGDYNQIHFIVQQLIAKIQTLTLVRVESCTNNGGLSPVGFVNVTPMVNQLDSSGNPTPHVTLYNIPYFRLQGGGNAVIIDPEPGDIGMCGFASRDISKVKSTKAQANPGSWRQFSYSDGLYLGGFLNGTPTQYVRFSSAGILLKSPNLVKLEAPDVQIVATDVAITSTTLTHNGINIGYDHQHVGSPTAPPGPVSNTGAPIP